MDYLNNNVTPKMAAKLSALERQFITLRSSGASIRDIAGKLKKSTHTICLWNKKFFREILELRNKVFCELQKKIIDSKTERLDFLKNELARVSDKMKREKKFELGFGDTYSKTLELYMKLSDLISACELDLMKVGINFRDNIEIESNLVPEDDASVAPVSDCCTQKEETDTTVNADKTVDKKPERQNCNDLQHSNVAAKYFHRKNST